MGSVIERLIREYFEMSDGALIIQYQEKILLVDEKIRLYISRRSLKHLVEQRKKDRYSLEEILSLLSDIQAIVSKNEYQIVSQRIKKKSTILLVQTAFNHSKGVVLVLEIVYVEENSYLIKTGFYRAISKIKKLLKQK